MATSAPAKIISAPGDVAIMDLVEGPVTFLDTRNNVTGKRHPPRDPCLLAIQLGMS